ncbi:hypothetical protein HDC94_002676 [Leifsonia sp. AK011]|uniref:hypothetical protein n=1 Tax=Leifsonia sp. AK011 TaxID=2723075 RepID=UPI0015C75F09|nr:hypothetical protein [Leifsonia sp. AK011]NYF11520.1 hypothetical protein [Leifsonia sp. AK011]
MRPLAIAALTVLLLAGCTATPQPEPTPTPTATPSPTPTAAAVPTSTVPLTCEELLTDAEASEAVQRPVTLRDPVYTRTGLAGAAEAQAGMLTCAWSPEGSTALPSTLTVSVLSGAAEDFASPETEHYSEGCDGVQPLIRCTTDQLAGEYWFVASAHDAEAPAERTSAAASSLFAELGSTLAERLNTAGPSNPPWEAPGTGFRAAACDEGEGAPSSVDYQSDYAIERAPFTRCFLADQWVFGSLADGEWAMGDIVAALPSAGKEMGRWEPIEIPGTDKALVASGEACAALVSIEGALISVGGPLVLDGDQASCAQFQRDLPGRLQEFIAAG